MNFKEKMRRLPHIHNRVFNRLFFVLTIGWALFCSVFLPLKMQWDGQVQAISRHDRDTKMCQQLMVDAPEWSMTKNCFERIDQNLDNTLNLYSFKNFWAWDALAWQLELLAVAVLPIFFYGIALLVRWIWNGRLPRILLIRP
jgi:hypothetical protein